MSNPAVADRLLVERNGQLRMDIAASLRRDRRQRREGECRACGKPTLAGWRLCRTHAQAMLSDLDDARSSYAAPRAA